MAGNALVNPGQSRHELGRFDGPEVGRRHRPRAFAKKNQKSERHAICSVIDTNER